MREVQMYPIIKDYLETLNFDVKAEIDDVDIMAVKDNKTLLIEMKNTLSLTLIYQGILRQKLSDFVYLAVSKPTEKIIKSKTFKEKKAIIKRLGLGLMLVDVDKSLITVLIDPSLPTVIKNNKKKKKLEKEFLLRKTTSNQGGVTQTKIITAYRELALEILAFLDGSEQPVQAIVNHTNQIKASRLLIDNHYGWFLRVERGIYKLSSKGEKALKTYETVINHLNEVKHQKNI